VPQVRGAIAALLHRLLDGAHPERVCRNMTRRLRRNEEARLYHWKRHKRLPPRRAEQRT
jgi:hypothetical protein